MTVTIGRCSIQENKPQSCKDYPKLGDYISERCAYHFEDGERKGSCEPEHCGEESCCSMPRRNGEPGATALPSGAGGEPCKHLRWADVEDEKEKTAEPGAAPTVNVARDVFAAGSHMLTGA